MWRVRERVEVHTGFWWGNLRKRNHPKNLGTDGNVILKWIFWKYAGRHGQNLLGTGQTEGARSCE